MATFKSWNYNDDTVTGWDSANLWFSSFGNLSGILEFADNLVCEKVGGTEIRIKAGVVISDGIAGKIQRGQTHNIILKPLLNGEKRIDFVVFKTQIISGQIAGELTVIEGARTTGNPVAPTLKKSNLEMGGNENELPLYRIELNGANILTIEQQAIIIKSNINELEELINNKPDLPFLTSELAKKTDKSWSVEEQTRVNAELDKKLSLVGGTMTGVLTLAPITPESTNHATNKKYVDDQILTRVSNTTYNTKMSSLDNKDAELENKIKANETSNTNNTNNINLKVSKSGDTMTGALQLPPSNPGGDYHATHKNYVDIQDSKKVDLTAYNTKMLNLDNKNISQDDLIKLKADKIYVDAQDLKNLSLTGGVMTGAIQLPVANPTVGTQVTHKAYVDARADAKADKTYVDAEMLKQVSKSGDIMSGMLTLPATVPTNINHATNKKYVDDLISKQVAFTDAVDWQKQKITSDIGATLGITKGVTFASYFQNNTTMLQHMYANKTDNTDAPSTIRGIIGNTGGVSTTAPNGIFWGIGLDYQGKLYGTHSKGNSSTIVDWQRYLDERDEARLQVGKITTEAGAVTKTVSTGNVTDFLINLSVGMHTVYIRSAVTGLPSGSSNLRGIIHKTDANTTDYIYGVCNVFLVSSNKGLAYIGELYGKEVIPLADWLSIRMATDPWETIYTSTAGVPLNANKSFTVKSGLPKSVRITLKEEIIMGVQPSDATTSFTVSMSYINTYSNDGVGYGFLRFESGKITYTNLSGNNYRILTKVEAIY